MMRTPAVAGLLLAAAACEPGAPPVTAGVSRALAEHRARTLSEIRYDLRAKILQSADRLFRAAAIVQHQRLESGDAVH